MDTLSSAETMSTSEETNFFLSKNKQRSKGLMNNLKVRFGLFQARINPILLF